jgi:predicted regulator of Ras-like GTPase activity (Roadblock/LC7/MglB family)
MSKLKNLLGRLRAIDSVELAAVVAHDGLLIESTARTGVDVDAICAVASNGLAMADALGREIRKGGSVQTLLEYEDGLVILEPINADAMLLLMASARAQLGQVRFAVAKHRDEFLNALNAI